MFCYHNKSSKYVFPHRKKIRLFDLFDGFFSYEGLVKVCIKAHSEKTAYKFLLKIYSQKLQRQKQYVQEIPVFRTGNDYSPCHTTPTESPPLFIGKKRCRIDNPACCEHSVKHITRGLFFKISSHHDLYTCYGLYIQFHKKVQFKLLKKKFFLDIYLLNIQNHIKSLKSVVNTFIRNTSLLISQTNSDI